MDLTDFPIEKANLIRSEPAKESGSRGALHRYVEPSTAWSGVVPGYVTILDYWYILIRHKRTLLCFALAGLGAALLISFLERPAYRARTSLEIRDFNENFLDLKSVDPTNPPGSSNIAESYFETQIKMLQSESLLERVIDKLKLQQARQTMGWQAFLSRIWPKLERSRSSWRPAEKDELIRKMQGNLTVRAAPNTRLLEVMYESPDPKQAADIANSLISEFIEQSQELRWKSTRRTAEWLTGHLDEMKSKLEQSEAQLQDYARTSGLTFTTSASQRDNIADIRLKELQDDLSRANADRVAKEAKFEEAKTKQMEALPEMLDDPTLRDQRLKLNDLQRQLAELTTTLTPEHFKVQRVKAQIAELQSAVQKERALVLSRIANEYMTARRREKFLTQASAEQEKIAADQSTKAIHYDTLKREVDSSRQLYEAMLQRVKQAEMASAMRASNVLVVDAAKPPLLPYKPDLLVNLAVGLFSSMFLGLGWVLFRERFDRRIQAPGDVRAYLSLPELGVIPLAEVPSLGQMRNFLSRRGRLIVSWLTNSRSQHHIGNNGQAKLTSGLPSESPAGDCPELATWMHKPSLLAESFRATLASILLSGQNGDRPRVVVVTSPVPGDGKTTVAVNLSIAMAETGRTVLLIDGDLRRPRVHKLLGATNLYGLSDILGANTLLDEKTSVQQMICQTKIPGLYLMPGGRPTTATAGLCFSSRLSGLLECLRREFDMILVDAPPMIHLADARLLGGLADGVVLVIRAGQTPLQSALFACQRFAEDGTHLLGTVLNSWNPRAGADYAYQEYFVKYSPETQ